MSEPDDDTKPDTGSDAKKQSLFDSGWDDVLGPPPTSPVFEPPAATPTDAAPTEVTPTTSPRTSDASASVSGEFIALTPRPEPTTPPRFEAPSGVTPNYDRNEDEWLEETAEELLTQLAALSPAAAAAFEHDMDDSDGGAEPEADDDDRDDQDGGESGSAHSRVERLDLGEGSSRNSVILLSLATVAAAIVLGFFVNNARKTEDAEHAVDRSSEQRVKGSTKDSSKQPAQRPTEHPIASAPFDDPSGTETRDPGTETSGTEAEAETGEAEIDDGGPSEPAADPSEPDPGADVDPRDPSLIPPGTPAENAKAFTKLPVSIHDGPPVGAIGLSGVHIDEIAMAYGRDNTECENPTRSFSASEIRYVNVCFRVVHPREKESLRVVWEKDGKVTRRGWVRIPDLHAYTTRAYLLVRPEYLGSWRVRIMPDGENGTDLAVARFEITE